MSKDFSSDNCFPSSIELTNLRFSPQNLKNYDEGTRLTSIYAKKFNNQSVTFPYQPERLRERLPEILQQLHSFKPLCSSGNQRELARKALTALKNRAKEDIGYIAKSLADDVADAVD
jgi:hypothetical protein